MVPLACAFRLAALAVLAEGPAAELADAELTTAEADWPDAQPSLQLSSGFFTDRAPAPERRSVLTEVLRAESHDARETFFGSLGVVTLLEAGGAGGSQRTTRVSNGEVGARLGLGLPLGLRGDVGLGAALGLTGSEPGPNRRIGRSALLHALAMDGAWDAWRWTSLGVGLFLPARLTKQHHLGPWSARLHAEATAAVTHEHSSGGFVLQEQDPGELLQAAVGETALCLPWLSAGTQLQLVWMPTATQFHTQTAVRPAVAAAFGPWRVGADLLVNLNGPYGLVGVGQRLWALHLQLGVWL